MPEEFDLNHFRAWVRARLSVANENLKQQVEKDAHSGVVMSLSTAEMRGRVASLKMVLDYLPMD